MGLKSTGVWARTVLIGDSVLFRQRGIFRKYDAMAIITNIHCVDWSINIRYPAGSNNPRCVRNLIQIFWIYGAADKLNFPVRIAGFSGKSVYAEQA